MAPGLAEYEPAPSVEVCDFLIASGNQTFTGYFARALVADVDARDKAGVRADYISTQLHETYTKLVNNAARIRDMLLSRTRKGKMDEGVAYRTYVDYVAYACDRVRLMLSPDARRTCVLLRACDCYRDRARAVSRALHDYESFKRVVLN